MALLSNAVVASKGMLPLCQDTGTAIIMGKKGQQVWTGVNDADYQPPFPLTAKLNKLTIKVDRPQLSPEDVKKLEAAMRNNKMSE